MYERERERERERESSNSYEGVLNISANVFHAPGVYQVLNWHIYVYIYISKTLTHTLSHVNQSHPLGIQLIPLIPPGYVSRYDIRAQFAVGTASAPPGCESCVPGTAGRSVRCVRLCVYVCARVYVRACVSESVWLCVRE